MVDGVRIDASVLVADAVADVVVAVTLFIDVVVVVADAVAAKK